MLEAKPNPDDYIDYGEEVRNYWGGCHIKQIEDYYRSLREGNDPWIDGHEGKATQDLVWAMYKSARQGQENQFIIDTIVLSYYNIIMALGRSVFFYQVLL